MIFKNLNIILILLILSSCTTASQQSGINRFRDYQKENLSCKYFAGAMMTDKYLYLDVDDWGYDEFGGVQFGCGNTMDEAKKNAIDACDYGVHGLLGKLTEVIYLGLLDFPCNVVFTEVNANPVYKFEGSKNECEKLGYTEGTEKFNKCVETLNEK